MEEEILIGNTDIAKFVGWKYFPPTDKNKNSIAQNGYWLYNGGMKINHFMFTTSAMYSLCFHESWDWLKPVIDKIFDETNDHDKSFSGNMIFELGLGSSINETWNAVVDFIKWYNENKSKV